MTYLVSDSLGSVRGTVNSSGTLTGTTSYDAWGNLETSGGLTAATPFGFAGGYTDPNGLVYLINRYYNPATGQFISVDPAIAQILQPYAYADGNPVTITDPTGLVGQSCHTYGGGWLRKCWYTLNSRETYDLLERLNEARDIDEEADEVSDAIPGADIAGVVLAITGGALTVLRYWLWDLYLDSGCHGLMIIVWYFSTWWWWVPYAAWPEPWY
jgi:RHS repeat-associated protein